MVVVHAQQPYAREVNIIDLKLEVEPQEIALKDKKLVVLL